jgi:hypothetical protein
MKQIIIILICLAFFCSCSKNKQQLFSEKDTAISFYDNNDFNGTINVNFLFYPETQKEVTVKIPLRISGMPQSHDRYYSVSIVKEGKNKMTAKEGIHYEKLKDKYLVRRDVYDDTLRIVILRKDKNLKDKVYKLVIKLKPTEDFKLGVGEDKNYRRYRHQIIITISENFNTPPEFWKNYARDNGYLSASEVGPYHSKKCQKFVEIAEIKDENWSAKDNLELTLLIKETKKWFKNHEILDENKNRLFFGNDDDDDW